MIFGSTLSAAWGGLDDHHRTAPWPAGPPRRRCRLEENLLTHFQGMLSLVGLHSALHPRGTRGTARGVPLLPITSKTRASKPPAAAAARDRQQVDNAARVVASAGISVRIPAVMVRFPSTRNWRQPRRPGKPTRSSQRMPRACMMASSSGKLFSFLAADAGRRHTRQRPGRRAFTRKRRPSSAHCVRTGEEAQSLHPRARKKRHSARRAAHRGRWRRTPRSASGERSRGPTWASSPEGARVKPGLSSNRLGRGLPSPRPRHPRALARAPGAPSRCAARRRSAPGGRGTPS